MKSTIDFDKLTVQKCQENEWKSLLAILEETQIAIWFSGREEYENFYAVKLGSEIIGCFTFSTNNKTGILKNFAIDKKLQGKGIGTYIANNIIPSVAKNLGIEDLYLHGNDRGPFTSNHFWRKTKFQHIPSDQIKDKYYLDYFNYLVSNYSNDLLCKESIFYLDLR